jgi:hypothetical protein
MRGAIQFHPDLSRACGREAASALQELLNKTPPVGGQLTIAPLVTSESRIGSLDVGRICRNPVVFSCGVAQAVRSHVPSLYGTEQSASLSCGRCAQAVRLRVARFRAAEPNAAVCASRKAVGAGICGRRWSAARKYQPHPGRLNLIRARHDCVRPERARAAADESGVPRDRRILQQRDISSHDRDFQARSLRVQIDRTRLSWTLPTAA